MKKKMRPGQQKTLYKRQGKTIVGFIYLNIICYKFSKNIFRLIKTKRQA